MRRPLGFALFAASMIPLAACAQDQPALAAPSVVPLTEIEIAAIQQACETVSNQYAVYLDGKDWQNLPSVFAPDGTWEVLGNVMTGSEQISAYWQQRTAAWDEFHGRLHQISNQVIEVIDRDHARGTSRVVIYFYDTRPGQNTTLAPQLIAQNHDEYVRTADGWRLSLRRIERLADIAH